MEVPKSKKIIAATFRRFLRKKAHSHLNKLLEKLHPADIAYVLKTLSKEERKELLKLIDPKLMAQIITKLDALTFTEIVEELSPEELASYIPHMDPDEAILLIDNLPNDKKEELLPLLEKYPHIWKLLQYGEETAGRIMSTEFLALHEDLTVEEAIEEVRKAREKEVFYVYVIDSRGHLVGVISLRELILSDPKAKLKDIMKTDVIYVTVDTDQEEVARIVDKYDLLAVPVVDHEKKLVGIVTADDVIDIIVEEATEDIYKMVGTTDEELWEKSLFKIALYRLPWLSFSLIGELLTGYVIHFYNNTLKEFVALSFFIPLVMALAGNVGNQAQTIVVRSLATGRLDPERPWKIILRQVGVGFIMGIIAGVVAAVAVYFIQKNVQLSLTIALSLLTSIVITAAVGTLTPLLFKKLNIDPALPSGPFITTFSDIIANFIYLSFATILLLKFG
ncbi:magnesium transporter, MgtE family [Thermosulfidibacter takaii ABI70S6]|uniref:Magnesium transporter MgtE n=1 Tax=Thermosulfidibacter takaii (strain DSM 17441 / JCM 13301 / NBRC 103674 / ABI70S6) TaxID=1298851 RepID=A0A0S3QS32_THET7|nr:magnesium transporter, MgtE family [Thermosulfidibacter takaii ABI70S6]